MNKYIKDGLGIAGVILGVAIGWSALSYVDTYSKSTEPSSYRSFTVSAEGEEVAVPDVAEFSFSVITEGGKDLAALQSENTAKVNKAIDFVKSKGIEAKDIKTSSYQVSPRYETSNCYGVYADGRTCPPPQIVGYTVTSSSDVKVRDFSKVGDLLSGTVENGANSVSQLSFTIDDPSSVEAKARDKAVAKAMDQARSVASAAGFKVGKLLSISENGGYYPVYRSLSSAKGAVADEISYVPSPTIEPGSETVNVSVMMTYEIR
jgi:hypothetical protein